MRKVTGPPRGKRIEDRGWRIARAPRPPRRPLSSILYLLSSILLAATAAGGCGVPSFLVTPVSSSTKLREEVVQEGRGWSPPKVAIIEVEGLLLNARTGGFLQATENDVSLFAQQLKRAEEDPDVRAVVLRVNSPGGTVSASDVLHHEVTGFRRRSKKPVVAAAQDVMASGAYYVACAADRVVVQPTSVVGSIGVIFQVFDASGTMQKIGLRSEAITSGPLKDMGSPLRPLGDDARAVMQAMVDEFHARFKAVVREGRKLDEQRLAAVTDGRVFSGARAVELGLADRQGHLTDAIDLARELAGVPDAAAVIYRRPYGYGGSIYARAQGPAAAAAAGSDGADGPRRIDVHLLPPATSLPTGFYYLWKP